jgi:uncharacterized membrane protein (DUF485 family)
MNKGWLVVYTVYIKIIGYLPRCIEVRWNDGFVICKGISFNVSQKMSIWERI